MDIFNITEVNFFMSLRIYHNVTLVTNDCVVHTLCLRPNMKLILTATVLKFSLIYFYIIYIKKIYKNLKIDQKYAKDIFA